MAPFPDGIFFVPLASATTPEVAWTTLGDVLEVPRGSRQPPRLFEQVANRTALFVLDSLEQLPEADHVVSELLAAAPHAAVMATSRRPLAVPGEHLYPVPPLGLPTGSTVADAEESPAVQLFLEHASSVRPDFQLTPDNVDAVAAICRRLDGLPLAIELTAARTRLLGPQALLRRIDTTLDLESMSRQGPPRHRTLRETIAWSYDLLPERHQAFFRRLGVFAGGADLGLADCGGAPRRVWRTARRPAGPRGRPRRRQSRTRVRGSRRRAAHHRPGDDPVVRSVGATRHGSARRGTVSARSPLPAGRRTAQGDPRLRPSPRPWPGGGRARQLP